MMKTEMSTEQLVVIVLFLLVTEEPLLSFALASKTLRIAIFPFDIGRHLLKVSCLTTLSVLKKREFALSSKCHEKKRRRKANALTIFSHTFPGILQ